MKLFKKIVMITFFFSISCMFIQSILPVGMDENKMKASKIEGITWNFEFKNKEKKAFQLSLKNGKTIILDRYAIQPSKGSAEKDHFYLRLSDLDLHKPVYIAIFYPDKKGTDHGFLIQGSGKTEFLTYENGSLRPQSGTGVFNKETQSGLSLQNNISDKNIEKLSYEKAMSYFNALVKTPEKPIKQPEEKQPSIPTPPPLPPKGGGEKTKPTRPKQPKKPSSELEKELGKRRGGMGGEHEEEQETEEQPLEKEKLIEKPVKEEPTIPTTRPTIPSPKELETGKGKLKPTKPQEQKI